jgi:AcrR family transcriptional regulator
VYQHFTDVEGLYADAAARTFDQVRSASKEIDPSWPLERRIEEFVADRATTLETLIPFSRASRLIEPTSAAIRQSRQAMQRWGRDRIARIFASELKQVEEPARACLLAALDTISSAEAWEHLRGSDHSVKSSRQVMRAGVAALLASIGH